MPWAPPIRGSRGRAFRLLALGYFLDARLSVSAAPGAAARCCWSRSRSAAPSSSTSCSQHQRGDHLLGRHRRLGDQLPRPRRQPGRRLRRLDQAASCRRRAGLGLRLAARSPSGGAPGPAPVGDRASTTTAASSIASAGDRRPTPIPATSSPCAPGARAASSAPARRSGRLRAVRRPAREIGARHAPRAHAHAADGGRPADRLRRAATAPAASARWR